MMSFNPASQHMKNFDRQRLNVVNKTRSNLFGRRGQFTSGLVRLGRVE